MPYGVRMTVVVLAGGEGATYVVVVGAGVGVVVVLTQPAKPTRANGSNRA